MIIVFGSNIPFHIKIYHFPMNYKNYSTNFFITRTAINVFIYFGKIIKINIPEKKCIVKATLFIVIYNKKNFIS